MVKLNKKDKKTNRRIRTLLLFFTVVFFIVFIVLFISSFNQYRSIQQRIQYLNKISNIEQTNYAKILSIFNEAENYFRLFSIDFNKDNYIRYEERLKALEISVDSLILAETTKNHSDQQYKMQKDLQRHESLIEDFVLLKVKINSILAFPEDLKELSKETTLFRKIQPPRFNIGTIDRDTLKNQTENEVVVRKSLLKRIFSKGDTVRFTSTEEIQKEQIRVIEQFEKDIDRFKVQNKQNYDLIKKSFLDLRKKEKALLASNFNILYSINEIISEVSNNQFLSRKEMTDRETSDLISKSNEFKWQIFLCLLFMFIMICIIAYYQFFTNYYENKLIVEKQYAAKLAEEKSDILAEITHEIRTPINSLIGIVDLLKRKKQLYNPEDQLLVDSAYSSITNTSKTIDDILNLSKIDYSKSIDFREFDIQELATEIISAHTNQAQIKNINLQFSFDKEAPTLIQCDEFKVRQIITNLISNAIKYSNRGTVQCSLSIDRQNNLLINVQDQGMGIPDTVKENIFKKYYTANKGAKANGGIGLGLFITKKLVDSIQGHISFQSVPNEGTTFKVRIPIPKPKFSVNLGSSPLNINSFPKELSWLIVDDNPLNLLYLQQYFAKYPNVTTVMNGAKAIQFLQSNPVNIIITDINMPEMRGDELLIEIRKNPVWKEIKIIATSSDNEQVTKLEKLHNIYFDAVLIKPFNERKLVDIIAKILGTNQ